MGKVISYRPHERQRELLARAFTLVNSVPYQVTARWLFYRLLQEGAYDDKKGYRTKFLPMLSKARKRFYKGWRPDTLADDTRQTVWRGGGYSDPRKWLEAIRDRSRCTLSKWACQDYYVELWFEANAMRSQFEYYSDHLPLRPFGGDPSIPFKWEIALHLTVLDQEWGKPIIVLYFGDLDPKGMIIPESARRDIQKWCTADFTFVRCGLNPGHEAEFSLMENPEKPGTYQWEALDDAGARELIQRNLLEFVSPGRYSEVEAREQVITTAFREAFDEFIEEYGHAIEEG